jgi:hypothetical protein
VFAQLDPEQFQECFREGIAAVEERTQGQIIALDGKKLRRSHDKTLGKKAIEGTTVIRRYFISSLASNAKQGQWSAELRCVATHRPQSTETRRHSQDQHSGET